MSQHHPTIPTTTTSYSPIPSQSSIPSIELPRPIRRYSSFSQIFFREAVPLLQAGASGDFHQHHFEPLAEGKDDAATFTKLLSQYWYKKLEEGDDVNHGKF